MSLNGIGELMTLVGLVALLAGEHKDRPGLRAAGKPFASLGFLVAAVGFGAFESRYGKIVFAGLVLGALGDVFLLGRARQFFIGGLVSFLLGHVAYVVAFASLGVDPTAAAVTALVMAVVMFFVGRWVFPHAPKMRAPISAYMLVIALMCVAAVGAYGAGAPWMIPVGAVMFTASDIAVVRDRFVSKGFINRAWGLPLYYAAQLLIAWSIAAVGA
jgi:uncharacterized membrane protein YhhN